MFAAKWKKDAQLLEKGAKKFVDYKRDLLKTERVAEIDARRKDLATAIRSKDLEKVRESSKQLQTICENSLPKDKPVGWFEENVEVMFVAIVIALGLRAYYLQPFRIPTGSMQPTLNGITGTPMKKADWPSLPQRLLEQVTRGRSYVYEVSDKDRHISISANGTMDLRDTQFLHFFSRSEIRFSDAPTLRLPAPLNPSMETGLNATLNYASRHGGLIPKGMVICEGYIDTGDLVLVDKFSYHFRKPNRGEVFVFNTLENEGILKRSGEQGAGSHYIKRLCGVPGDRMSVASPHVLVNGSIAKEFGMQRVAAGQGVYNINPNGYGYARPEGPHYGKTLPQYITKPGEELVLAAKASPGMREYAAFGDNSSNSLDSRYWGPVKEWNLVGPALFSLWPITTGHWGFID
jgi:signal peptidase I